MGKNQSRANSHQVAPESKFDESLENGPIDKRSCRDILCCLLFIFACVCGVGIAIFGFGKGDPNRLITPYDYDAQGCGYSPGLEEYKYLYYAMPYPGYLDKTICVKTCPRTDVSATEVECKNNSLYKWNSNGKCSIVPDFSLGGVDWSKSYQVIDTITNYMEDYNFMVIYNSTPMPYFGRICIPAFNITTLAEVAAKNSSISANVQSNFNASEAGTYSSNSTILNTMGSVLRWADDVKTCWWVILLVGGIAVVVGFVYLVVLRYCVGCLIWVGLLIYFCICGLLCYFAYAQQKKYDAWAEEANVSNNSITWVTVFKYFIWVWTGVSVIIFCCMYHKIQLAIAVLKTASNFIGDVKTSLFVPILTIVLIVCYWIFWIPGFVYIWSNGDAPTSYDVRTSFTPFPGVRWSGNTPYLVIYFLGWGLWCNAFINAIGQFVLACAVCLWYFSQGAGQGVHKPISRSFYYCFRYHWGSLAFGSLILAIVQLVRLILMYIQKQYEKTAKKGSNNKFISCAFWIINCYLACLERFIKMLNKNAYIQIALQGKSFCGAAKDAIMVILKNPLRFAAVNGFGRVFIGLGKFFICIGSTTIGYIIMRYSSLNDKISSVIAPGIIMGLISYFMGQLFMQVYGMAISAILHCFILDEEIGKQKGRKAKFTPPLLQRFLEKYEASKEEEVKK